MHGYEQMRRRGFSLAVVAMVGMIVCLLLAACGQKGDLYLPADVPPGQQRNQ